MIPSAHTIRFTHQRANFELAVNLTLPAKGITVLYGASGSGKTSLLRCVAGLERPREGFIQIAGEVWQDDSKHVFLPTWRRSLAYVFQEASLFTHLDVRGNLRYAQRDKQGHRAVEDFDKAVELLGITHLLNRRTEQLSGGERQRVAIARALLTHARVLLMDEPLASLDHARRQEILPWLERLRDQLQIPILLVTHSSDEVARLAGTLVVMKEGQVLASGPVAEILGQIDSPIVLGEDVGALLDGTVIEKDEAWHLAKVAFSGGSLWVKDTGLSMQQAIRIRILARDVSISTSYALETSVQNLLPCSVQGIVSDGHPSQVLVQLRMGSTLLLARITAKAVALLQLRVGLSVWAQVKSVALVGS